MLHKSIHSINSSDLWKKRWVFRPKLPRFVTQISLMHKFESFLAGENWRAWARIPRWLGGVFEKCQYSADLCNAFLHDFLTVLKRVIGVFSPLYRVIERIKLDAQTDRGTHIRCHIFTYVMRFLL